MYDTTFGKKCHFSKQNPKKGTMSLLFMLHAFHQNGHPFWSMHKLYLS